MKKLFIIVGLVIALTLIVHAVNKELKMKAFMGACHAQVESEVGSIVHRCFYKFYELDCEKKWEGK